VQLGGSLPQESRRGHASRSQATGPYADGAHRASSFSGAMCPAGGLGGGSHMAWGLVWLGRVRRRIRGVVMGARDAAQAHPLFPE
jgi:hypothetical protein